VNRVGDGDEPVFVYPMMWLTEVDKAFLVWIYTVLVWHVF